MFRLHLRVSNIDPKVLVTTNGELYVWCRVLMEPGLKPLLVSVLTTYPSEMSAEKCRIPGVAARPLEQFLQCQRSGRQTHLQQPLQTLNDPSRP
ncbi:hypothetical protein EMIT0194P_230024 [Pseudomonas serbica]